VAATGARSSSGAADSSAQRHRTSSQSPTRVYRLRFSRDWIARRGPRRRRQTTLTFTLRKPALVDFVVIQVAPECRRVGRFRVKGRAGRNRVRFRGRIGRRMLGPGTYRIRARTARGARVVDARLVIVKRANKNEIANARSADACASAAGHSTSSGSTTGGGTGQASTSTVASSGSATSGKSATKSAPRSHGVLGTHFTKAVSTVKSIPLILWVVLALAIGLLAVASFPLQATPNRRAAAILVNRRGLIALAGAAALAVAMVAYVLH